MNSNFWNSYEINCISKDLNYSDYLRIHKEFELKHKPLNITSYKKLNDILNDEFEYYQNEKSSKNT